MPITINMEIFMGKKHAVKKSVLTKQQSTKFKFGFRSAVGVVALLNIIYFGVEFYYGIKIGAVTLFADSIDFLEDSFVNGMVFMAFYWPIALRSKISMGLAVMMIIPAVATLVAVGLKIISGQPPDAFTLSSVGFGALLVNVTAALLIAPFRKQSDSLVKLAFYSARNDALANIGIIATGVITHYYVSIIPDILVGLAIAYLNADAARDVYNSAKREYNNSGKAKTAKN